MDALAHRRSDPRHSGGAPRYHRGDQRPAAALCRHAGTGLRHRPAAGQRRGKFHEQPDGRAFRLFSGDAGAVFLCPHRPRPLPQRHPHDLCVHGGVLSVCHPQQRGAVPRPAGGAHLRGLCGAAHAGDRCVLAVRAAGGHRLAHLRGGKHDVLHAGCAGDEPAEHLCGAVHRYHADSVQHRKPRPGAGQPGHAGGPAGHRCAHQGGDPPQRRGTHQGHSGAGRCALRHDHGGH